MLSIGGHKPVFKGRTWAFIYPLLINILSYTINFYRVKQHALIVFFVQILLHYYLLFNLKMNINGKNWNILTNERWDRDQKLYDKKKKQQQLYNSSLAKMVIELKPDDFIQKMKEKQKCFNVYEML